MENKPVEKKVVHLRVYKGAKMSYDENQKPQNENHLVKTPYDSLEWKNLMERLSGSGFVKVDVENVITLVNPGPDEKGKDVKDFSDIKKEVEIAFKKGKVQAPEKTDLSAIVEQNKKLAEQNERLAAQNEKLSGEIDKIKGTNVASNDIDNKATPPETKEGDAENDISVLRTEYKKLHPEGKGAFNGWDEETLKQKIKEFKNS